MNIKVSDESFAADYLSKSLAAMTRLSEDVESVKILVSMSQVITQAFRNEGKLLVAGNGGSAADAQHIAGEFVSRLFFDRAPLPAFALTADSSVLTAVGNDYGYEDVFDRQVRALGMKGDLLLGISTSGKSPNIVRALASARFRNMTTLGFTGSGGGEMCDHCDLVFRAPAATTALIQQLHIIAAHIVCGLVERDLCANVSDSGEQRSRSAVPA